MIKLQDFATEMGVTDRAIQKHLKTYEKELEGLYERKGPNGTWLSDAACDFLRGKMRQQPIVVGDQEQLREMNRLKEALEQERLENKRLYEELKNTALKITELADWKADNALLIASAEFTKAALEEKVQIIEDMKIEHENNISDMREEFFENTKYLSDQIEKLQEELAAEKAKSWWQKLRGK